MVNLEWYRSFKAIYEEGTLTRAAEVLFASQPGVSLHLNSLESYVGRKLFERTSRKMIPTEDGKQLYGFIIDGMERLLEAETYFKKSSVLQRPVLNIGMCSETFQLILEPEIPFLEFDLMAKFDAHAHLIRDLNAGLLDLVITPLNQEQKRSPVTYTAFTRERIILVAGNKTDSRELKSLLCEENYKEAANMLSRQTWYSASNDMEHFRRFWYENFGERPGFKPNYILPSINSIVRCLSGHSGYATIPDFLAGAALERGELQLVWKGRSFTGNTLHFASRNDHVFKEQIGKLKEIFIHKMPYLTGDQDKM